MILDITRKIQMHVFIIKDFGILLPGYIALRRSKCLGLSEALALTEKIKQIACIC